MTRVDFEQAARPVVFAVFVAAWDRTFVRSAHDKASHARGEGEAFVRLQVGADGVPSDWQVMSEAPRGFALGDARVEALKEEAWQAELDENGRPITTRVVYRCGFDVSW